MYNNIYMAKCFQPTMYVFIAPPPYTYVLLKYILCLIDYSLELIITTRKLNDTSGWLNHISAQVIIVGQLLIKYFWPLHINQ